MYFFSFKHLYLCFFQFFFDAVLTIETMLDAAIFHLALNPEMQEKAYDEIQVRKYFK